MGSFLHPGYVYWDGLKYILQASSVTGPASGDLSGNFPNPEVVGLRGHPLSAATPTTGQVLAYDGTSWVPTTTGGGAPSGVAGGDLTGSYPNPKVAAISGIGGFADVACELQPDSDVFYQIGDSTARFTTLYARNGVIGGTNPTTAGVTMTIVAENGHTSGAHAGGNLTLSGGTGYAMEGATHGTVSIYSGPFDIADFSTSQITVYRNLIPNSDASYQLGLFSKRWSHIYSQSGMLGGANVGVTGSNMSLTPETGTATGGNLVAALQAPIGGGTEAYLSITRGGTANVALGTYPGGPTSGTLWLGASAVTPGGGNYTLYSDGATTTVINGYTNLETIGNVIPTVDITYSLGSAGDVLRYTTVYAQSGLDGGTSTTGAGVDLTIHAENALLASSANGGNIVLNAGSQDGLTASAGAVKFAIDGYGPYAEMILTNTPGGGQISALQFIQPGGTLASTQIDISIGKIGAGALAGIHGSNITINAEHGYNGGAGSGTDGGSIILNIGNGGTGITHAGNPGDLVISNATTTTSAFAGSNGDVPAQVVGYLECVINNTRVRIPYYSSVG